MVIGKAYKQYKHILVPLDGSELAEQVLPDALLLAQSSQAEMTLLQVIIPMEHSLDPDVDDPDFIAEQGEKYKTLARQYLQSVATQLEQVDIPLHIEAIMEDSPAEGIIEYTNEHAVDLIVMATHGRSGFQRWVYGSVTDKVLRGADVTVLLVRARHKDVTKQENG